MLSSCNKRQCCFLKNYILEPKIVHNINSNTEYRNINVTKKTFILETLHHQNYQNEAQETFLTTDAKILSSVINLSFKNVMRFFGMISISNNLVLYWLIRLCYIFTRLKKIFLSCKWLQCYFLTYYILGSRILRKMLSPIYLQEIACLLI